MNAEFVLAIAFENSRLEDSGDRGLGFGLADAVILSARLRDSFTGSRA